MSEKHHNTEAALNSEQRARAEMVKLGASFSSAATPLAQRATSRCY